MGQPLCWSGRHVVGLPLSCSLMGGMSVALQEMERKYRLGPPPEAGEEVWAWPPLGAESEVWACPPPGGSGVRTHTCVRGNIRGSSRCGVEGCKCVYVESSVKSFDVKGKDVCFCTSLDHFRCEKGRRMCVYMEASVSPRDVRAVDACVCTWKLPWLLPMWERRRHV